jgi:hypothetical protein
LERHEGHRNALSFAVQHRAHLCRGDDKTAAAFPSLPGTPAWPPRGEITPDKLPADVVLTAYTKDFCMLEEEDLHRHRTHSTKHGPALKEILAAISSEAMRLKLASALLSVASDDTRDVEVLKKAALKEMAGDYRWQPMQLPTKQ